MHAHKCLGGAQGPQQPTGIRPQPHLANRGSKIFEPFVWTATADEVLARVRWVETNVKKLIANNTSNGYGITEH